jgi:DUF1365 family protein
MQSAIYQGVINHRRNDAVRHGFQYPLFMLYLNLDEIDEFFSQSRLWSNERFNWASFYRNDYLNPDIADLKQAVIDEIKQKTGKSFTGNIFALTHVRYLGYCFNPATFYYCFNNGKLDFIVTEVSNTPWNERHCYVLSCEKEESTYNFTSAKEFHVSPFLSMNMEYHWKFSLPAQRLKLYISNKCNGSMVFTAGLRLTRLDATTKNLNRTLLRFPAVTLKTIIGIYWQALMLWAKGATFQNHPKDTKED